MLSSANDRQLRSHGYRRWVSRSPIQLPDKLFFKIGEVAAMVGVKTHVLRYWETEFRQLKPLKTRGAHRMYKREHIELAANIKQLLNDEGYTIAGAKKKLREQKRAKAALKSATQHTKEVAKTSSVTSKAEASSEDMVKQIQNIVDNTAELALRAELLHMRQVLVNLRHDVERLSTAPVYREGSEATIERVSPGQSFVRVAKPALKTRQR